MLQSIVAICAGASLGALARWGLGLGLNSAFSAIPLGTLAANLIGGYFIGLALGLFAQQPELPAHWRLFVITGFLGGLTTFSTFSSEVTDLLQEGRLSLAVGAILLHVVGSLSMTLLGLASAEMLKR